MVTYTRSSTALGSTLGLVDAWLNVVVTAGQIVVTNYDGTLTRITGTGFQLDALNVPTAGTITKIEHLSSTNIPLETFDIAPGAYALTDYYAQISGLFETTLLAGADIINGGSGDDDLNGYGGSDTIQGGLGADNIDGGAGNDVIFGDGGNDFIVSNDGQGADNIDGGTGLDNAFIDRSGLATAQIVNFSNANATATLSDTTKIIHVEAITFHSGSGDDVVTASNDIAGDLGNRLYGGAGNDTLTASARGAFLSGGDGADMLNGGVGYDFIDGGIGDDIIQTGGSGHLGQDIIIGGAGNDQITANFSGNHTIFGDDNADSSGPAGDDIIDLSAVLAGFDNAIFGGGGHDVITGSAGNDDVTGGFGDDVVNGGAGVDIAHFSGAAAGYSIERIDGAPNLWRVTDTNLLNGNDGQDTVSNFETFDFGGLTSVSVATYIGVLADSNAAGDVVMQGAVNGDATGVTARAIDGSGDAVAYALIDDAGGRFQIGSATGVVTVADGSLIDFATQARHTIIAQATSADGSFTRKSFLVGVSTQSPNAPTDSNAAANIVAEGAATGAGVGITVSAIDPGGLPLTYSLTDTAGGRFQIDSQTGVVTVANGALIDFETQTNHVIVARSANSSGTASSQTFSIAVGDVNERPTAVILSAAAILENNAVGVLAGNLDALDPDGATSGFAGPFAFALVAGTGSADNGSFSIVGNELHFNTIANFEAKSSYSLRIAVTDQGGLTFEQQTTVTIADVNEAPTSLTASNVQQLAENTVGQTVLADLAIVDPDTDPLFKTYTYTVNDARFDVVGGQLVLKANQTVDYEAAKTIALTVTANDPLHSIATPVTIAITDVNDNAPVITTAATATVVEHTTFVAALASTDADTVGTNPAVFSITGGADAALFAISGSNLVFTSGHDFLTEKHSYNVAVTASDGLLQTTKAMTVNLLPTNHAPTALALSSASASEFAHNGTVVGNLAGLDPDAGETFSYALLDNGDGRFALSGNTLTVANGLLLDYEQAVSHEVKVRVTDHGGLSFDQVFKIAVGNVDAENIMGDAGNNTFVGSQFKDIINGGAGDDRITGAWSKDLLTGGVGRDVFDYNAKQDSGKTVSSRDVITDFLHGQDKIDLKDIDANLKKTGDQAFKFIGQSAFHHTVGELHFAKFDNPGKLHDYTLVEGDINGDGHADFQIELKGLIALSKADFVL